MVIDCAPRFHDNGVLVSKRLASGLRPHGQASHTKCDPAFGSESSFFCTCTARVQSHKWRFLSWIRTLSDNLQRGHVGIEVSHRAILFSRARSAKTCCAFLVRPTRVVAGFRCIVTVLE